MGVKKGWMKEKKGWRVGEGVGGRDKRSKSQACAGMLRIGRHVNLNPFRERRKRRRKGEQGTELEGGVAARQRGVRWRGKKREGCEIFVFLLSPSSPQRVISQSQAGAGKSLRTSQSPAS